jgi:hypothetical protein
MGFQKENSFFPDSALLEAPALLPRSTAYQSSGPEPSVALRARSGPVFLLLFFSFGLRLPLDWGSWRKASRQTFSEAGNIPNYQGGNSQGLLVLRRLRS